jgi:hypothetical protein
MTHLLLVGAMGPVGAARQTLQSTNSIVEVEVLNIEILACPDTRVMSGHASNMCCLLMKTAHPASETAELRLGITATSCLAFTVCASMVTTPDLHLLRRPRAQHRPRQASPSQPATDPSLRTSRPPPCRTLAGRPQSTWSDNRRFPAGPSYVPVYNFSSLSCNVPAYRVAEPLCSTKSKNCEVEWQGAVS